MAEFPTALDGMAAAYDAKRAVREASQASERDITAPDPDFVG